MWILFFFDIVLSWVCFFWSWVLDLDFFVLCLDRFFDKSYFSGSLSLDLELRISRIVFLDIDFYTFFFIDILFLDLEFWIWVFGSYFLILFLWALICVGSIFGGSRVLDIDLWILFVDHLFDDLGLLDLFCDFGFCVSIFGHYFRIFIFIDLVFCWV